MSGVIVRSVSVAANSVDENIFSGSAYEFLPGNSFISMGVVQSVTGLFITIQSGGQVVAEEFEPPIELTAFPQTNEDFYFNAFGVGGDRLIMRVRNSTGGAIIVRGIAQITDV